VSLCIWIPASGEALCQPSPIPLVNGWPKRRRFIATWHCYPEIESALHRRFRPGTRKAGGYDLLVRPFAASGGIFAVIDFDEIAAGRLAAVHGLRDSNAVHLSAAETAQVFGKAPAVRSHRSTRSLNSALPRNGSRSCSRNNRENLILGLLTFVWV